MPNEYKFLSNNFWFRYFFWGTSFIGQGATSKSCGYNSPAIKYNFTQSRNNLPDTKYNLREAGWRICTPISGGKSRMPHVIWNMLVDHSLFLHPCRLLVCSLWPLMPEARESKDHSLLQMLLWLGTAAGASKLPPSTWWTVGCFFERRYITHIGGPVLIVFGANATLRIRKTGEG